MIISIITSISFVLLLLSLLLLSSSLLYATFVEGQHREGVHQGPGDRLPVGAGGQAVHVGDLPAVDEAHGEHPPE